MRETQPDLGVASTPVEVHLYRVGRAQLCGGGVVWFWAWASVAEEAAAAAMKWKNFIFEEEKRIKTPQKVKRDEKQKCKV